MNKKCARCEKTVYPIEELKCLDKLWHKQCFKCQSCGMTLNMRNYKGFNKDPYCEAHVPKAKATSVAETPELKRIAENTKIQSNVKYHADFEKTKGKLTQVADDPETLRLKQNSQIQSNVAYHGDLKKKAEMEQKRTLTSENDQQNVPHYDQISEVLPESYVKSAEPSRSIIKNSPYSARQSSTLIYSSNKGQLNANSGRSVGSIADLDPVNNFYGSLAHTQNSHSSQYNESRMMPPPRQEMTKSGNIYRAMYDYDARESDEVSFLDGDIILNCIHIHDGWMSGVVQRTGECGLLPANYVQSIII
ncbi:hypothetical protein PGB90_009248 [Kerria lacca]